MAHDSVVKFNAMLGLATLLEALTDRGKIDWIVIDGSLGPGMAPLPKYQAEINTDKGGIEVIIYDINGHIRFEINSISKGSMIQRKDGKSFGYNYTLSYNQTSWPVQNLLVKARTSAQYNKARLEELLAVMMD